MKLAPPKSLLLLAAAWIVGAAPAPAQEFRSSVVGTDFDYITDDDPSTFLCLEYKGEGEREMPDKSGPGPLRRPAQNFVAYFEDGTRVEMAIDADFETEENARAEAMRYVHRLGKLPTSLRRGVERIVVHEGHEETTAFSDRGLIVLYSDNATKRISTHDLEETLFHESVHAAWDIPHADSPEWREAQESDGRFVTDYARKNPDGEDLAESALFAYALLHHPERIPRSAASRIRKAIPARIAFVERLLPPGDPIFFPVAPAYPCDGSDRPMPAGCDVNLRRVESLSDIVSNALMIGLDRDEAAVSSFLAEAKSDGMTPDELLAAVVVEFGVDRAALDAKVREFTHCNCDHE